MTWVHISSCSNAEKHRCTNLIVAPLCVPPTHIHSLISCLFSPIIHPLSPNCTVGLSTPGPHKLEPWKTSERRENRDARKSEGRRRGSVRSPRSFSIPMEQKVNDGPIVLGESWPEEKCRSVTGNHRLYQWAATKGGRRQAALIFFFFFGKMDDKKCLGINRLPC